MCINKALLEDMVREIYESEGELFELDVGEWALAFRLGLRLVAAVEGGDNPDLRVDCEYNKLGKNKKTVAGKERRPDIIVHRRGDSDKNVLAIECKRILNGNKGERRLDVDKLLNLKEDENFAYECVALVEFGGTMGDTVVSWGEEGLKGRKHELE